MGTFCPRCGKTEWFHWCNAWAEQELGPNWREILAKRDVYERDN